MYAKRLGYIWEEGDFNESRVGGQSLHMQGHATQPRCSFVAIVCVVNNIAQHNVWGGQDGHLIR